MKMLHLGKVVRRLSGRFSNRNEEEMDDFSLSRLTDAFTRATDIMAQENHFLMEKDVAGAAALLPEKTVLIEELGALVTHARKTGVRAENLPASFRQVQGRFMDIATQNRELLQEAMTTQEAVMKLFIDSAVEENRHGYGRTGEVGSDTSSRGVFFLNDRA